MLFGAQVSVPEHHGITYRSTAGYAVSIADFDYWNEYSSDILFQVIYNYVYSHPLSPEEFEITTNFPKRVLDCSEQSKTLGNVGLKNRDVLFVNDCNA